MPIADLGDVSIHYRVSGNGPPVLGIMGFAADQRLWAAQVPTVAESNTFITFDNRGTGSSSPGSAITMEDMAADAVGLLDHLEIDKATVFGVSMGGAVAQRLVLNHPDRVDALILALTWARPIEYMRRENALARAVLSGGGQDALVEASLVRMFTPSFFEVGREAIDQLLLAFGAQDASDFPPVQVLEAQLDAVEKHDVLAELGRIRCPTLVVGGKFEMMVEEMDAFNARLRDFLASIRAEVR